MKRSVSTDLRMRDAIAWDPGCNDDKIELPQSNLAFDGYPVHSVSLRDKHERAIILDKTPQNARLQTSKFILAATVTN